MSMLLTSAGTSIDGDPASVQTLHWHTLSEAQWAAFVETEWTTFLE